MNTKIEGMAPGMPRPSSGSAASSTAGTANTAGLGGAVQRGPVNASDSVNLSGEAAGLASLERSMAEQPAFDDAKVAALRAAFETGTYKIDAQEIAARLTDLERALGV